MATVAQVCKMFRAGKTTQDILDELHITPSRFAAIMASRRIKKIGLLQRDVVPAVAKMLVIGSAMSAFHRLKDLSNADGDPGRRACEALLEQLNLNYPPVASVAARKASWE
jgi:hypothetical protein